VAFVAVWFIAFHDRILRGKTFSGHSMIDVVLDTSILRQDPKREKAAFRALKRLCWQKQVQVHIPEFVQREFLSQQEELIRKEISDIQSSANSILRRTRRKELSDYAKKVIKEANEIYPKISDEVIGEFKKWIDGTRAKSPRINIDHARVVIDAYFQGSPPFKTRKNRSDIPDSFIWQAICDIATRTKQLHFVCGDGALYEAAASKEGITPY
jgi:hypothetical protein